MNGCSNKKVLILYHSGTGSTKTIVEIYFQLLNKYNTEMLSVSKNFDYAIIQQFDFLIFAFPTYHCEPSSSMMHFIREMPALGSKVAAFAFTTYGLYSGNAIRIFAKETEKKNIVMAGYADYRAPATDGSLRFPPFKFMYRYENNIARNIMHDIEALHKLIAANNLVKNIPSFKLYTILNAPNQYFGKMYRPEIRPVNNACIKCGKCIKGCPHNCWSVSGSGYPVFNKADCECCYRCIHHCPQNALVLSKKTINKKKMNSDFYKRKEKDILDVIQNKLR